MATTKLSGWADDFVHRLGIRLQLKDVLLARKDFRRVVRHMEQRRRPSLRDGLKQVEDFPPVVFVKAVARLVENQYLGGFHRGADNKDCALLPVAQVPEAFRTAPLEPRKLEPSARRLNLDVGALLVQPD